MRKKFDKQVKPRNVLVDTMLHAWMAFSMVSLIPLLYFCGTFLYYALTSGLLEKLSKSPVALNEVPTEQIDAMLICFCLLVNYAIFKHFCQVVLNPRVGMGAMLRSDVKSMNDDLV